MKKTRKDGYVESADFIPKDLRKKHKLGEYAEKKPKSTTSKTTKKK